MFARLDGCFVFRFQCGGSFDGVGLVSQTRDQLVDSVVALGKVENGFWIIFVQGVSDCLFQFLEQYLAPGGYGDILEMQQEPEFETFVGPCAIDALTFG